MVSYCEPAFLVTTTGWLFEPVNTLTNIAFVISGMAVWRYKSRFRVVGIDFNFMIAFILLTAFGSALWHGTRTYLGMWLDVFGILLFQITYLAAYAQRVWKISRVWNVLLVGLFIVSSFIIERLWDASVLGDIVKGTGGYLPCLVFLAVMAWYVRNKDRLFMKRLWCGLAVFIVSLSFRTVDLLLCDATGVGSHFIWHVLNGYLLYIISIGLMDYSKKNSLV